MSQPVNRPRMLQRRLGRLLRRMREQTGYTQEEAGRLMEWSDSKISRIEGGAIKVDIHWVRSLLSIYDVGGLYGEEVIELARDALQPGWWKAYGVDDRGYLPLEDDANTVFEYQVLLMPGLVQTEDYARAVFTKNGHRRPRKIENDLAVRMRRQRRLTDPDHPLHLVAVIEEDALHRPVGDNEIMREQLVKLLQASRLPTVSLRVLPRAVGVHDGIYGAFIVLEYPDRDDPELVFVDHQAGSVVMEKPDQVNVCKLAFKDLLRDALSEQGSLALIQRVIDEVWSVAWPNGP